MLNLANLSCQRGRQILWNDIQVTVAPGQILFVAGANGSGKSSLLRMIAGLSLPVEGKVYWFDQDIHEEPTLFREQLLYIGHQAPLKPEFNALENLDALAQLHGMQITLSELQSALAYWELEAKKMRLPVKQLSQGQKQRTALAQLSFLRKKIWILDEPFNSLDPQGTQLLTQLLKNQLSQQGMVIITSHLHADADEIDASFQAISQRITL
jgi:heme exporter protein A